MLFFAFNEATLHTCHTNRYRPTFSSGGERAVLSQCACGLDRSVWASNECNEIDTCTLARTPGENASAAAAATPVRSAWLQHRSSRLGQWFLSSVLGRSWDKPDWLTVFPVVSMDFSFGRSCFCVTETDKLRRKETVWVLDDTLNV